MHVPTEYIEDTLTPSPTSQTTENAQTLILQAEEFEKSDPKRIGPLAHQILQMPNLDGHIRARALRLLAAAAAMASDYVTAGRHYREALERFEQHDDELSIAKCLGELGMVEFMHGSFQAALTFARRSLRAHQTLGDQFGEAVENMRVGILMQHLGDLPRALEHLLNSYEYLRHDQTPKAYAGCLNNLALVYKDLGQLDEALEMFERCREICNQDDNSRGLSLVHSNMGVAYQGKEDWPSAQKHLELAGELAREIGDLRQEAIVGLNIASIQFSMEQFQAAAESYENSISLVEGVQVEHSKVDPVIGLARCMLRMGKIDRARALLTQAQKHAEETRLPEIQAYLAQVYMELHEQQQEFGEAYKWSRRYHEAEQVKMKHINDEKLSKLRILHETEQARQEASIRRLENVELAAANGRLEELIRNKNEFLGVVAHDLRNPLANIQGMARLISAEAKQTPYGDLHELAEDISGSAQRMLKLVAGLLDINRIDQGRLNIKPHEFDLTETCNRYLSVCRSTALEKNIDLQFIGPQSGVRAFADRDIIVQVLDNLVSNAVKFSPSGTKVEVLVDTVKHAETTHARIRVRDQGPGMTEQDMQQLFGKFARLSARPTGGEASSGLGLSIVKHLVEAMCGKVWCESRHGAGATFIVELPTVPC